MFLSLCFFIPLGICMLVHKHIHLVFMTLNAEINIEQKNFIGSMNRKHCCSLGYYPSVSVIQLLSTYAFGLLRMRCGFYAPSLLKCLGRWIHRQIHNHS
jgi:hypothetical protein